MALRRRAQLDHVHRLARVHVHDESHAIRHRHGVLRDDRAGRRSTSASCSAAERSMTSRQSASPPASTSASGCDVAVARRQRLPVDRQQPMTLQIAERAVVGEHVEAIARALERAARLVPAIACGRRRRRAAPRARSAGGIAPRDRSSSSSGKRRRRVERGGDDLRLAVGIEVGRA